MAVSWLQLSLSACPSQATFCAPVYVNACAQTSLRYSISTMLFCFIIAEVTERGDTGLLSEKQTKDLLNSNADLLAVSQKHNRTGCIALWATEQLLEGIALEDSAHVQIKTQGNGPFISTRE